MTRRKSRLGWHYQLVLTGVAPGKPELTLREVYVRDGRIVAVSGPVTPRAATPAEMELTLRRMLWAVDQPALLDGSWPQTGEAVHD
jgi:hypothetical protein